MYLPLLAVAGLGTGYILSCASGKRGGSGAKGDERAADTVTDSSDVSGDEGNLPHPKRATAWHTRTLINTTPQPPADRVSGCIEQVQTVAAEAGSEDDLLAAPASLKPLAAADPSLYHFCLYQMAARLDERLAAGGPLMTDVATTFFDGMRALWILARALDQATGQERYFRYAQRRYLQLSRDYFGREIQVVGPPLGGVARPPDGAFGAKAAGAAKVD